MSLIEDRAELKRLGRDPILVTGGVREPCGISRFARRLAAHLTGASGELAVPVRPHLASEVGADVVVNFEYGVMSRLRALKLVSNARRSVVIVHTLRRSDRRFFDTLRRRAYTIAMHPYAEDEVDDVILHPASTVPDDVVVPDRVRALGVFGLIRPGKGIEAAAKLASELGLDLVVHGRVQSEEVRDALTELSELTGVGIEVNEGRWDVRDVRGAVRDGVLPVVPSVSTGVDTIWASGTEADLIGARVPYVPYPVFGGHNPCAYAIRYGGPSHVTMFTEGVDAAAERSAEFVRSVRPVPWPKFARAVHEALRG